MTKDKLPDTEAIPVVEKGVLYLVSTPIGNLKDTTLRAVEILKGVDLIAAEDTRRTRVLQQAYSIRTSTVSYHDHNKRRRAPELLARLQRGESVAVVCDAGTPGISDPAFYLVRLCAEQGITVRPAPGATAFVAALVVSGLPTDRFVFEGFLPARKGRQKRLTELVEESRTLVFYESPHRLERTLQDLRAALGDRQAAIARELTKVHEEIRRGKLSDLLENVRQVPARGEIVLVVEGLGRRSRRERLRSPGSEKKGKV